MKIVHLCLQSPYNDYWGYQDNLLPKYHIKQGHNVTVITTNTTHADGKIKTIDTADYKLEDGQRIIRLDYLRLFPKKVFDILQYYKIYDLLCNIKPDFIMVHGLCNISVLQIARYMRNINNQCKVVADSHLDYYNGRQFLSKKYIPLKMLYRMLNYRMQKIYSAVYGITPWREQFMQDIFCIKRNKSRLLVVGGDDEKIDIVNRKEISTELRKKYDVEQDDFLIVTGGKIDETKNIHLLMKAVNEIESDKIKLIVFGKSDSSMERTIRELTDGTKVKTIGWIAAEDAYKFFLAADLVVFPGTHSVMWEQACACGTPCVFKHWEGMHHVDVGGNCEFLYGDTVEEIRRVIEDICLNESKYITMKLAAPKGIKEFSYNEIAKRAIEL